jgi:hypothetical protein
VSCPDNVWDFDCTSLFRPDQTDIHSAYFGEPQTLDVMRDLLRGIDRKIVAGKLNRTKGEP